MRLCIYWRSTPEISATRKRFIMVPPIPLLEPYVSCTSFSAASAAVFSGPCSRPRDNTVPPAAALPLVSKSMLPVAARAGVAATASTRASVVALAKRERDRELLTHGCASCSVDEARSQMRRRVRSGLSAIGVPPMWAQPSSGRLNGYQSAYACSPAASRALPRDQLGHRPAHWSTFRPVTTFG